MRLDYTVPNSLTGPALVPFPSSLKLDAQHLATSLLWFTQGESNYGAPPLGLTMFGSYVDAILRIRSIAPGLRACYRPNSS